MEKSFNFFLSKIKANTKRQYTKYAIFKLKICITEKQTNNFLSLHSSDIMLKISDSIDQIQITI